MQLFQLTKYVQLTIVLNLRLSDYNNKRKNILCNVDFLRCSENVNFFIDQRIILMYLGQAKLKVFYSWMKL